MCCSLFILFDVQIVSSLASGNIFKLLCVFFFFLILFIFVWVGSSLLRTGFLQLRQVGATLHCCAWTSHCGGFSCCGAWALGVRASVVAARGLSSCGSRALERRLSSCGTRAQLLHGTWDLPGPGLEPVSPALAGGFLTTAPQGKSLVCVLLMPLQQSLITSLLSDVTRQSRFILYISCSKPGTSHSKYS